MIRTRFAPSPTGLLHLGNVRTAVFNWLFARHHGGAFVLRVEDTDVGRNVEGSEAELMWDLRWLGLDWDEGPDVGGEFGPYRQSERTVRYREVADQLIARGAAYHCFCSADEGRGESEAVGQHYPGTCRDLNPEEVRRRLDAGEPAAVRFRVPDVDNIEITDEIRGSITFPSNDFGDFVLLRPDGRPTYNYGVVVDDAHMQISHVVRGAGHLSNTPRQVMIYNAMEWPLPAFAHLPTVLSPNGGKLSKRAGAPGVSELRDAGFLPGAVVNYLSLLGWSSEDEEEVFEVEELARRMTLGRVGASDTMYDPEKLKWMSAQHLAKLDIDVLVGVLERYIEEADFPLEGDRMTAAVEALRSRLTTFGEFSTYVRQFIYPPEEVLLEAAKELRTDVEASRIVGALVLALEGGTEWQAEVLGKVVRDLGKKLGAKGPALFHPIRKAISGSESGPDLGRILVAIGREEALRRLRAAAPNR